MTVAKSQNSRREELLAIAAEVFAERGFVGATTREIASRAEILSGSLYHHFSSKEEMMEEIVRRHMEDIIKRYSDICSRSGPATSRLRDFLREIVLVSALRPNEVTILHRDMHEIEGFLPYFSGYMDDIKRMAFALIDEGKVSGLIRKDVNNEIIYRTLLGATIWTIRWYRPGGRLSIEEIADEQADLLMRGLLAS